MNEEEIKKAAEEAIKALAEKTATDAAQKSIESKNFISKEDAEKATSEAITKALDAQKTNLEGQITALSAEVKKASQISNVSKEKLTYESSLVKALVDKGQNINSVNLKLHSLEEVYHSFFEEGQNEAE